MNACGRFPCGMTTGGCPICGAAGMNPPLSPMYYPQSSHFPHAGLRLPADVRIDVSKPDMPAEILHGDCRRNDQMTDKEREYSETRILIENYCARITASTDHNDMLSHAARIAELVARAKELRIWHSIDPKPESGPWSEPVMSASDTIVKC